jgi:SAM-dependent MidA family methyltransferase
VPENNLPAFLRSLQEECGGAIPFERFMQEALYHPQFGYYTAHISDVGARGDFSTAATLDEGLGIAIAAWIKDRSNALQWKRTSVIEVGAGSGALASTVLHHLGWIKRLRTDYRIVEASPILRKRQKEALRGRRVAWCHSMEEALKQSEGRALIFSNELVDAFPCRLFERVDSGWKEVGVYFANDGSLREVLLDHQDDEPAFQGFNELPIGHRVEQHGSYRAWLEGWRHEWKEGFLLTIDYGDTEETLYKRRPLGSMRAYWKHQLRTGLEVYARFGKQDITADVNFSNLISWGEEVGWNTISLASQREFLMSWLPLKRRGSISERFTSPGDAGDAFRTLEQSRTR